MTGFKYKTFEEFFVKATGNKPYPYQSRLANSDKIPSAIRVPTGAGKTEAAILGIWLWRRLTGSAPTRLLYCLPMRTLVEQTTKRVEDWLRNLHLDDIGVVTLMGGSENEEFQKHPAKSYIIIGTQDMLVSGALNRAYGRTPYAWPMFFGLFNNDCMWIMDEVQIMENALPTSLQLDAFRNKLGTYGSHQTVWMSATLNPDWLKTVDSPTPPSLFVLEKDDHNHAQLKKRNNAKKILHKAEISLKPKYGKKEAEYLYNLHTKGSVTAIMVNTVKRAQELYDFFEKKAECKLVHSRFRAKDRQELNKWINDKDTKDKIIVSTQVLEAGVDISVRTLITEVAPWPSMVQRFGRCNRDDNLECGDVYWIDIPDQKHMLPYDEDSIMHAREELKKRDGKSISPANLQDIREDKIFDMVLRKRDLMDLFDNASDLSGNYTDASRFVRTIKQSLDVEVFWRKPVSVQDKKCSWPNEKGSQEPRPERDELCSVPMGDLKKFLSDPKVHGYAWSYPDNKWTRVRKGDLFPSQVIMLNCEDGGYSDKKGWTQKNDGTVCVLKNSKQDSNSNISDPESATVPLTLEVHTGHVLDEIDDILGGIGFIGDPIREALRTAVKYHDIGKAHAIFQDAMRRGNDEKSGTGKVWAKCKKKNMHYKIPGFRHEAASALVFLEQKEAKQTELRDLVAYLIMSHHGKIRLSMRNITNAQFKGREQYLLGIKSGGDIVPAFSGRIVSTKETKIDIMSLAEIGQGAQSGPSWTDRALGLRDKYRPFRLAYLETLIRAADGLASQKEEEGKYD